MPKPRKKKVASRVGGGGSETDLVRDEAHRDTGEGGGASLQVGESSSVVGDRVGAPARRRKRPPITDEEDEERDLVHDEEDDCAVAGDSDCNAVDDAVDGEDGNDGGEDGLGVMVVANINIAEDFADIVGDEDRSDDDSGDDIWDDDKIPDPISSDDEDEVEDEEDRSEEANRRETDADNPEVFIAAEKTYNSPDDFKLALLRYSLKTRYDIKLYRSEGTRIGAKCCYVDDDGVECPWKVYASYEKKKHKLQIRTYVNEHVCIRSGYSKMLKCSTIALLFEERLRLNQKLTKNDMVDEIKREYNLEVSPDQCAKAKTKVLKARKASNESHFARIWGIVWD